MQNIKKKKVMTGSSLLLDEMIVEILSWLPVKSLLRLKCVCKMWCSTIEDPKFVVMHMSRAPYTIGAFKLKTPEFSFITYDQGGLILEKNKLTNAYRVRNPATRQILDLPGPPKRSGYPERSGYRADLCYIPATNDLKFVYMHYLKKKSAENGSRCMLVYDVLRAGSSSDHLTWKRLVSPSSCQRRRLLPVGVIIGTVLYCVKQGLMSELLMDCVDLESEEIKRTISIPSKSFLKGIKKSIMDWNGKPCLAQIVVENETSQEQLSVLVLDKHNNHEGGRDSRRVMISVKFMKDYPWMSKANISPLRVEGNQMTWLFKEAGSRSMFNVDMESHEVKVLASTTEEERMALCHYKPTLIHINGMRAEQ